MLEREETTPLTSALLRFKKGKRGCRWMALRVVRAGEEELEGEWRAVAGRPPQTTGSESQTIGKSR